MYQKLHGALLRRASEFWQPKNFFPPLTRSALSFASRIQFDRFYYFNESRIRVTPKSIFIYNEFLLRE